MKKLLLTILSIFFIVSVASLASATDVAYVVKSYEDWTVANALNEIGVSYDVIPESKVASTNFSQYLFILVGNDQFANPNAIPVSEHKSLIMNQYHYYRTGKIIYNYQWGWSIDPGSISSPSTIKIINRNETITKDIPDRINGYIINDKDVQTYYLKGSKPVGIRSIAYHSSEPAEFVIAYVSAGTRMLNGKIAKGKSLFFGATEAQYWTEETENMFQNSVLWLMSDEDRDGDKYKIKDGDCNDNDASIHPKATEILYDYIDQDCSGYDLADSDGDGYCKAGYEIQNALVQCNLETGSVGTDCNDNIDEINPGSNDSKKNCVNEAPVVLNATTNLTWYEDGNKLIYLRDYFSDPDGDVLDYSIYDSSNSSGIIIWMNNETLPAKDAVIFGTEENWNGIDWIIFAATDPNGEISISKVINLIVLPVNDAPVLTKVRNVFGVAGETIKPEFDYYDPEGDNVTLVYGTPLNSDGEWKTSKNDGGNYESWVELKDGNKTEKYHFNLTVLERLYINEFSSNSEDGIDWVEIYNPYDKSVSLEGCRLMGSESVQEINGSISAKAFKKINLDFMIDYRGDELMINCKDQLIDYVSYGDFNNQSWNAPAHEWGESVGRIYDGKDSESLMDDFKVYSIPTAGMKNDADMHLPSVELVSPLNESFDKRRVEFKYVAEDNQELECSLYGEWAGGWKKIATQDYNETNAKFEIDGINDGEHKWNVQCYDGTNYVFAGGNGTIKVDAPDAPTIDSISEKVYSEGQKVEFVITASDSDSSSLEYRLSKAPKGAQIFKDGSLNARFVWTPDYNQSGEYEIKVIAKDSDGLEDSETFKIVIGDREEPESFDDIDACDAINEGIVIDIRDPDDGDDFEIGETIEGKIKIKNNLDEDLDFDVEVHLYDLDEDESVEKVKDDLDVDEGDSEEMEFELKIPDDIEGEDFAIVVRVEDGDICNIGYIEIEIEREDDRLKIDDINVVEARKGERTSVIVKVQNIGADDQDDVQIEIVNTELGVKEITEEFELEKFDDDDTETKTIEFLVPANATEKTYTFDVNVYYNGEEENGQFELRVVDGASEIVYQPTTNSVINLNDNNDVIKATEGNGAIKLTGKTTSERKDSLDVKIVDDVKTENVNVKSSFSWLWFIALALVIAIAVVIASIIRLKR